MQAAQIKFVMINSYYGDAPINYVGSDDAAIGTAAAEYLAERGHTRIGFLSGLSTLPAHHHLVKGLRHGLAGHGLTLNPERIGCTQYDMGQAFAILDRWFRVKRNRPTAIFTTDDEILVYLYDYAEERGISLPQDLAVLSRGNSISGDHLRPKPTTLAIPTFRMGEVATDLLIDSIEKTETLPQRILLPYELIRGTTA